MDERFSAEGWFRNRLSCLVRPAVLWRTMSADQAASLPTIADHDGFVEALYHLLWAKTFNGEPCQVLVPDTIIFKYRIPAYWYFTGADGRLRRKNKASIVNQKIFKDFTAGARSDKDVVACHISEHPLAGDTSNQGHDDGPPASTHTVIQYFDKASLYEFLYHQEKVNDGCLQKFVRPKGLFNSMIQACWSPQLCLLERRVNLSPLLSGRAPLQERTATYEGSEHLSRIAPVRGTLLADQVQQLCADMVAHIQATSPQKQRVSRMLVNFKTDVNDHLWFLWCSSVRVAIDDDDATKSALASTKPSSAARFSNLPPPARSGSAHRTDLVSGEATAPLSRASGVKGGGDVGTDGGGTLSSAPSFMRLSQVSSSSRLSSSRLAAVCLNPTVTSPAKVSRPRGTTEIVCPFTGAPLDSRAPYFVTYATLLQYQKLLDLRAGVRRDSSEVPPLLARVCPDLDSTLYAREYDNPLSLFLHTRVLCSEAAYLEFSTVAMPGFKTLPALSVQVKRSLLASASAPTLPAIPGAAPRPSASREKLRSRAVDHAHEDD